MSEQIDAPAPAAVHAATIARLHGIDVPPIVTTVPAAHATETAAQPAPAAPQHAARHATPLTDAT